MLVPATAYSEKTLQSACFRCSDKCAVTTRVRSEHLLGAGIEVMTHAEYSWLQCEMMAIMLTMRKSNAIDMLRGPLEAMAVTTISCLLGFV